MCFLPLSSYSGDTLRRGLRFLSLMTHLSKKRGSMSGGLRPTNTRISRVSVPRPVDNHGISRVLAPLPKSPHPRESVRFFYLWAGVRHCFFGKPLLPSRTIFFLLAAVWGRQRLHITSSL